MAKRLRPTKGWSFKKRKKKNTSKKKKTVRRGKTKLTLKLGRKLNSVNMCQSRNYLRSFKPNNIKKNLQPKILQASISNLRVKMFSSPVPEKNHISKFRGTCEVWSQIHSHGKGPYQMYASFTESWFKNISRWKDGPNPKRWI